MEKAASRCGLWFNWTLVRTQAARHPPVVLPVVLVVVFTAAARAKARPETSDPFAELAAAIANIARGSSKPLSPTQKVCERRRLYRRGSALSTEKCRPFRRIAGLLLSRQHRSAAISLWSVTCGQVVAGRTETTLKGRVVPSCSVIDTYSPGRKTWRSNLNAGSSSSVPGR